MVETAGHYRNAPSNSGKSNRLIFLNVPRDVSVYFSDFPTKTVGVRARKKIEETKETFSILSAILLCSFHVSDLPSSYWQMFLYYLSISSTLAHVCS